MQINKILLISVQCCFAGS